jgi:hypothetical protein
VKVGFDYWQVLSRYPDQFKVLVNFPALRRTSGVHLVSCGKNRAGTVEDEVTKLYMSHPLDHTLDSKGSNATVLMLQYRHAS